MLEWNDIGPEFSHALRYATEGKHKTVVRLLREYCMNLDFAALKVRQVKSI